MNKIKTEEIENFKINYKKHCFSKNIKISLKQDSTILVTMPIYCPYKTAREFLLSNFEKIKGFKKEENFLSKDLKTKFETLKIIESDSLKVETKKNIVYFYYPNDVDFNSEIVQDKLKEAYLRALKIEAKNYLPDRLNYLAKKYGFSYRKVSLRNQKTRFGSCSYFNDISLNINLMRYDFDCIDYVIIHELCHTRVKNHSEKFWIEVGNIIPNYKAIRRRLKQG